MEEQINRLEFKNKVDHYSKEPSFDWRLPPDEKLGFSGIFPIPIATFYYPHNGLSSSLPWGSPYGGLNVELGQHNH